MEHHQLHGPLAPGMSPKHTRVLAVGGDTTRLHNLVTNLRLLRYQVTSSTDPAAAMAGLRQGGGVQGLSSDVVMVDRSSQYPGGARAAAFELFLFAVREPQLCAYVIHDDGTFGPLVMDDLNQFRKTICNADSNGPKSPQVTQNGPYNSSPSMMPFKITNSSSSRRKEQRNNMKHIRDSINEKVEQDEAPVEMEQQQSAQQPKKSRVVWTEELHKKFVEAFDKLIARGEDPVPKKILALMGDSSLTRENIASHLQKYRSSLLREACTDPLPTIHPRTKQHMSTSQESFPSPNMSQQQAPSIVMRSQSATVFANDVMIHVQTNNTTDKSNLSVLVDVPPKDMYSGADDPKQNGVSCVDNPDDNSFPEDTINVILSKEPEPTWDAEFLHSNRD